MRQVENALQLLPVERGPFDQLRAAPAIFFLLGIDVADPLHIAKITAADPEIGKFPEILPGEEQPFRHFCLERIGEGLTVAEQQSGCRRAVRQDLIKTGGLILPVKSGEQQRICSRNKFCFRIQFHITEAQVAFSAEAFGEIPGGAFAGRITGPDVVLVVYQNFAVTFQPSGNAIGIGCVGPVVLFILQRMGNAGAKHPRGAAAGIRHLPGQLLPVPPEKIARLGGQLRTGLHFFQHFTSLAAVEIDQVSIIIIGIIPGHLLAVGEVGNTQSNGGIPLAARNHLRYGLVA